MNSDTEEKTWHMARLHYLRVEISALGAIWNKLPVILNFILPSVLKPMLAAEVEILQRIAPPSIIGFMGAHD